MRQVFRSKFRITQYFNNNPAYYGQFGLKGHEGIDLVPTGTVLDVLCLEDGVVVKDDDIAGEPKYDAYGKSVTVWHPKIRKATMYCHLASNTVSEGDIVTKGQVLGPMGKTGNTTGPHLHLNLFDVDENGIRLNKNNGYLGGIDPLPFLETAEEPAEETALQACLAQHTEMVTKLNGIELFQKNISAVLFPSEPMKSWQGVLDRTNIILRELDDYRRLERVLNTLWDALVKETGVVAIKYQNDSLVTLLDTLKKIRETPPAGKVIVDEKTLIDLQERADKPLAKYDGWQLISIGIGKLFRRGGEKKT